MTNFIDGECVANIIKTELLQEAKGIRVRSFEHIGDPKLHITTPKDDEACRFSAWINPQKPSIRIDELYPREPLQGVGARWLRAIECVAQEFGIETLEVQATSNSKPFWEKMGFKPDRMPDHLVKQIKK
jgi:GNAT superfamily N-acetyltransferase